MKLEELGDKIRAYRLEIGLTQQELGNHLHVSGKAVSKWENHRCYPDICLLEDLAKTLNTTVDDLIGIESSSDEMIMEILEKDMKIKSLTYLLLNIATACVTLVTFVFLMVLQMNYAIVVLVCVFLYALLMQVCSTIVYKTDFWEVSCRRL